MSKKTIKSIKKEIKDTKDLISHKSVLEKWEEEKQWGKRHPILATIKEAWRIVRYQIPRDIMDIPSNIKYFIQRGKRGYADCDVWNFDGYLSHVILGGLTVLKSNKIGYPYGLTPKKWDIILMKMIRGFKLLVELQDNDRFNYSSELSAKFKKKYNCLSKTEDRYINEAFELLSKYYGNLWD